MSDVALIERAEELLAAQGARVAALLPEGSQPFDAHTHLGLDEDGHSLSVAQHLRLMDDAGVSAANVFALNEPDREPAYRAPNDRILRWSAEAPDRLFPFVRLSLEDGEDPLQEAERCLALGARGIKLHPRAQAFRVNDPRLEAVFALADERRLPVLIHAGRGLPPGMPLELGHVAERHPGASLILAHAAIVAQARIGELARRVENIFFDSSTWTPLDQLNLLSLVPPEQILWASDIPYGEPLAALNVFVRAARVSGAGDELLRGMLGEHARGLLEGRRPERRSAPLAPAEYHTSYARARASMYMAAATTLLWIGLPERVGFLGLAESALHEEGLDDQAELVRCTAALWAQWAATVVPDAPPDLAGRGRVFRLLSAAQANTVLA
ncbi:MAG: amidohydrolase family protein [Actinomycetota bacterium]|nr:amidohydrolase family protein [Actinomycetota bacterium]